MENLLKLFDGIIENFDFSFLKKEGDFKNKNIFVVGKNKFIRRELSESSFPDEERKIKAKEKSHKLFSSQFCADIKKRKNKKIKLGGKNEEIYNYPLDVYCGNCTIFKYTLCPSSLSYNTIGS